MQDNKEEKYYSGIVISNQGFPLEYRDSQEFKENKGPGNREDAFGVRWWNAEIRDPWESCIDRVLGKLDYQGEIYTEESDDVGYGSFNQNSKSSINRKNMATS